MTKSRTLRKAGAVVLSLAMAFSVAATTPASAAAKPALKKTKVSVKVKKSVKVGIKNAKLVKKLTVKSKNSKVAKAAAVGKKAVKITGVKAGTAKVTVTIKYGKKTLKKNIKVTVKPVSTTNDDNVSVIEGKITLEDASGLQTDGTGAKGDTLKASIPLEIGSIDQLLWYQNGKVVNTTSANGTGVERTNVGTGEWYVVALTTKGTTYKSNTIKVTKEVRAEVKALKIGDDYTDKFIDVNADTEKSIWTVTLNKAYDGQIELYASKDGKALSGKKINFVIPTTAAVVAQGATAPTVGSGFIPYDEEVSDHELYTKSTINTATGAVTATLIGRWSDENGVNYKFFVPQKVTRGTKYVALFDQKNVIDDDINATTPNISPETEAAYLTAPKSIAFDSLSTGDKVVIGCKGEDGKNLGWMGKTATNGTKTAFKDAGISSAVIYKNKSNAVSNKDTTKLTVTDGVSGGQIWGDPADKDYAWYLAEVKFAKGIYGAAEVVLATPATVINANVADSATVAPLATDAKTAEVKLTNLRADAKVYLIKGKQKDDGSAYYRSYEERSEEFDPSNNNTYDAVVDVKKGDSSAKFENAFSGVETTGSLNTAGSKAQLNTYGIVVVPEDTANFGKVRSSQWADDAKTKKVALAQKVAKYAFVDGVGNNGFTKTATVGGLNAQITATANGIVFQTKTGVTNIADTILFKDQYGAAIKAAYVNSASLLGAATRTLSFKKVGDAASGITSVSMTINSNDGNGFGVYGFTVAQASTGVNGNDFASGEKWTATDELTGQTFTVEGYKPTSDSFADSAKTIAFENAGGVYFKVSVSA